MMEQNVQLSLLLHQDFRGFSIRNLLPSSIFTFSFVDKITDLFWTFCIKFTNLPVKPSATASSDVPSLGTEMFALMSNSIPLSQLPGCLDKFCRKFQISSDEKNLKIEPSTRSHWLMASTGTSYFKYLPQICTFLGEEFYQGSPTSASARYWKDL